jgi:hypothetical protein
MDERIFTLEEAQNMLPRLRSLLTEISEVWNAVRELNPEIQKARDNAQFDGYSKAGARYVESVSHLTFLIQQIKDMGVLLKDVCDFPYVRQGRIVYLCWQLGEERIEYWHDIETGFAGREPLDETDS